MIRRRAADRQRAGMAELLRPESYRCGRLNAGSIEAPRRAATPASSRKFGEAFNMNGDGLDQRGDGHLPSSVDQMIAERVEQELKHCLDHAAEGLHWVGPDGTILWANQTELDLLGYTREEYIGHNIAEFHVDRPVIEDILRRLTRGDTLRNHKARVRAKDGTIRHVEINSNVLWRDGEFLHTRCFTRDITDRKSADDLARRLAVSSRIRTTRSSVRM